MRDRHVHDCRRHACRKVQGVTALDFAMEPDTRKLEVCRRLLANCHDWGMVGRAMCLRGDFDHEPEMLRLMAAYEEGRRHG